MAQSIAQLKNLWDQDKEQYKTVEIGSGVQIFVKEIFKSEELFFLILNPGNFQRRFKT